MKSPDMRDIASGVTLIAIGLFAAIYAYANYRMGTVTRMGPGFVPFWLGCIVAGLGTLIAVLPFLSARRDTIEPPPFHPRPLIAILVAVLLFAGLVTRIGLVPTTLIVTFVSALAERGFDLKRTAMLAVTLAALIWVIFLLLLDMRLPAIVLPG
ncbi:tripartite tricarboxylate transporter TctB family protein [Celeribacter naphthalenivorans]|uniref:tripartite tricarboxylate transporter TctB family protein n=1 Tax=Celeribacter naphthalenivorans TaxID=1614694 RepID=UPI001CFAADFF|nr:tripartite tricarboxylate transporter TctB family protein [Celeribacter naphthalenivorans]